MLLSLVNLPVQATIGDAAKNKKSVTPLAAGVTAACIVTDTPTSTRRPSKTPTETCTAGDTDTPTATFTSSLPPSATDTQTVTEIPSDTLTPTDTQTPTATDQDTATDTLTPTDTLTSTLTETLTDTITPTNTEPATETYTATETVTASATSSETATSTQTSTLTSTFTETLTPTATMTVSTDTSTNTATITSTGVPNLELAYECGFYGSDHYTWLVTNPNAFAIYFTWEVAGKQEHGHGTVAAGSKTTFKTSRGHKTVLLLVDGVQVDSAVSDTGQNEFCLYDLDLDQSCNSTGGITWTIKNPNDFDVDFRAYLDDNVIEDTLDDNSTYHLYSSNSAHSLDVSWSYEEWTRHESLSSSSDACQNYPVFPNLGLVYTCSADGIIWTASNANNDTVYFVWQLNGTEQGGSAFIPSHSILNFVKSPRGNQEVRITWYSGSTQKTIDLSTGPLYCSNVTNTPLPTSTPLPTLTPTWTITPTWTVTPTWTMTSTQTYTATTIVQPGEVRIPTSTTVPTLPRPSPGGNVLIPVTGTDLTAPSGLNLLQTSLVNAGLLFLGMAFILQGISRRLARI